MYLPPLLKSTAVNLFLLRQGAEIPPKAREKPAVLALLGGSYES
jgi:hypothetical protein